MVLYYDLPRRLYQRVAVKRGEGMRRDREMLDYICCEKMKVGGRKSRLKRELSVTTDGLESAAVGVSDGG